MENREAQLKKDNKEEWKSLSENGLNVIYAEI
jgi:hypothetical protein